MKKQLEGKIALVTGSSRGLGKNAAIRLAEEGADLIITYRNSDAEAQQVVAEIEGMGQQAVALPLDVMKVSTFDDFVEKVKTRANAPN